MRQPSIFCSVSPAAAPASAPASAESALPESAEPRIRSSSACCGLTISRSISSPSWQAFSICRRTSTDFSRASIASLVTCLRPSRISSSSVSMIWVKLATSVKPNVPAPPLIEWAARKIELISSGSASPGCIPSNPDSMISRPSKLSSKKT